MVTTTQKLKTFEPSHGYTKEDCDAVDFPELTNEELANMRPAKEVLPPEFFKAIEEHRRSRGRPSLEHPKKQIILRLDEDVIAKFRASGKGWQGRMKRYEKLQVYSWFTKPAHFQHTRMATAYKPTA